MNTMFPCQVSVKGTAVIKFLFLKKKGAIKSKGSALLITLTTTCMSNGRRLPWLPKLCIEFRDDAVE